MKNSKIIMKNNAVLGIQTDKINFFVVGYLNRISVNKNANKNGCRKVPKIAKTP